MHINNASKITLRISIINWMLIIVNQGLLTKVFSLSYREQSKTFISLRTSLEIRLISVYNIRVICIHINIMYGWFYLEYIEQNISYAICNHSSAPTTLLYWCKPDGHKYGYKYMYEGVLFWLLRFNCQMHTIYTNILELQYCTN